MSNKFTIYEQELEQLVELYDGEILERADNRIRIEINTLIIDVWLSTGTYMNVKTYFKSKGIKSLNEYLDYCIKHSGKSNKAVKDDKTTEDIAELKKQLEAITKRVTALEEASTDTTPPF